MSPPTKPTACIDDLPPEMISELFEYLSPMDLAACSMVNKRWHSIHAAFKLHRLAVIDYDPPDYDLIKWYPYNHINRPIREAERCRLWLLHGLVEKPLLSNLKHLALCSSFAFDLNELNRFQHLVHLEIDLRSSSGEVHLNLARLNVLAFHHFNRTCQLSIDCPELSTLEYFEDEDANRLEVKHPETIRNLETNLVDPEWLARYKGVECLFTCQFEAINVATLFSLPRLSELCYDRNIESVVSYEFGSERGTLDRLKRTLSEFVDEAKKLRGSDFRFTFSGFQLTNVNVDQIDFDVQVNEESEREYVSNEYVYMKNYHLIEPGALHFVHHVNYSDLLSHVTGEFPRCFSQKFTDVHSVYVEGVIEEPDQLHWFLKSLRFLRILKFVKDRPELSQKFYDQLPASAPSLNSLEFRGDLKNKLQLNFHFISEFPAISELVIYQPLSLQSFASLIRSSTKLVNPRFNVCPNKDCTFRIEKESGSTLWKITDPSTRRTLFEAENPNEIVNFLEELSA